MGAAEEHWPALFGEHRHVLCGQGVPPGRRLVLEVPDRLHLRQPLTGVALVDVRPAGQLVARCRSARGQVLEQAQLVADRREQTGERGAEVGEHGAHERLGPGFVEARRGGHRAASAGTASESTCSRVISIPWTSRAWLWALPTSSSSVPPRTTNPQSQLMILA